jgi:hypothetical protein
MTRRGLLVAILLTAAVAGCTKTTPLAGNSAITVIRAGGDVGVDDRLVVEPDGSWTYTDNSGKHQAQTGKLDADKVAAAYAIVRSEGFAAEIARPSYPPGCIDPPQVTIAVDGHQSSFISCGDARQQYMNDLLKILLVEIYNKTGM